MKIILDKIKKLRVLKSIGNDYSIINSFDQIKSVLNKNQPFIWLFDGKKSQKWYVAAILKRLKITEVMSKPNDLKK